LNRRFICRRVFASVSRVRRIGDRRDKCNAIGVAKQPISIGRCALLGRIRSRRRSHPMVHRAKPTAKCFVFLSFIHLCVPKGLLVRPGTRRRAGRRRRARGTARAVVRAIHTRSRVPIVVSDTCRFTGAAASRRRTGAARSATHSGRARTCGLWRVSGDAVSCPRAAAHSDRVASLCQSARHRAAPVGARARRRHAPGAQSRRCGAALRARRALGLVLCALADRARQAHRRRGALSRGRHRVPRPQQLHHHCADHDWSPGAVCLSPAPHLEGPVRRASRQVPRAPQPHGGRRQLCRLPLVSRHTEAAVRAQSLALSLRFEARRQDGARRAPPPRPSA
jgi:hypothetical protein